MYVSDLVIWYTEIDRIGANSITIAAQIFTEKTEHTGNTHQLVAEARLTYVAIDAAGHPEPVER